MTPQWKWFTVWTWFRSDWQPRNGGIYTTPEVADALVRHFNGRATVVRELPEPPSLLEDHEHPVRWYLVSSWGGWPIGWLYTDRHTRSSINGYIRSPAKYPREQVALSAPGGPVVAVA